MGNAVGFPRRNLLVPVPEADPPDWPDGRPASGCDRIDAVERQIENTA